MTATTLGSLMVQAHPIRSPRCAAARLDEAGEALGGVGRLPAAPGGEPPRRREVVEGDDREDPVPVAGRAHPAVVLERGERRTRPRPARSGSTRARSGTRRGPMSATSCTSSRQRWKESQASPLGSSGARRRVVLPRPPVVVDVAALDLVRRRGDAPDEARRERELVRVGLPLARSQRRRVAGAAPACRDARAGACEHGRMSASLEFLVNLLDLEPIEVNIFRGIQPNEERQRVFGGQVAGQALMAAGRTVEHGRVHSLHSYFLRPGDPTVPILYEVDRIRDGRSFTTRRVVAIQHGRAIFNLSASFHDHEEGLEHQFPMPDVPRARDARAALRAARAVEGRAGRLVRPAPPDRPAPHRRAARGTAQGAGEPYQRLWIRADGDAPRRPAAARLRGDLRVGHVALRHHPRPARRRAGTTRTSWAPASTTACGSTGPSGPTSGCSTTRTRRSPPRARGLARGFLFDRAGALVRLAGPGGAGPRCARPDARR